MATARCAARMYIRFSSTTVPVRPRSPAQPIGSPSTQATTNVPPGAANGSAARFCPARRTLDLLLDLVERGSVRQSPYAGLAELELTVAG